MRMRLVRLAAPLVLSVLTVACGPSAPSDLVAERTDDLFAVQLRWSGPCADSCDVAVHDERFARIATGQAPVDAVSYLVRLPVSVKELARLTVSVRNVEGTRESGWASVPHQVGIWPVSGLSLWTRYWSGGEARREMTFGWSHGSVHADGSRLARRVSRAGDPAEAPWDLVPVDRAATTFEDPEVARYVDRAVFEYRVESLAGEVPSPPRTMASQPAPPAPPADVSLALEGGTLRLRFRNRSAIATALEVSREDHTAVATLSPSAVSWEDAATGPGFFRRGVQAVARGDPWVVREVSGYVDASLFVPDPALDPLFRQGTLVLPSAEIASRMRDGRWALASNMHGFGSPAEIRVPEGEGWAVWMSPPRGPWNSRSGAVAAPGPLVDPAGRVHAIVGPGYDVSAPAGPVLHVWREDGAWHEEEIGFGIVQLTQVWAAMDAEGHVHALWRSWEAAADATYATNRGGAWITEDVPGTAFGLDDDERRPFAVAPGGEAVVLLPAPPGEPPGFVLHRRLAGEWVSERIPDGLAVAPGSVGLVATSADRITWLAPCGGSQLALDVCLRVRTETGWGPDELLDQGVPFFYDSGFIAASADGSRLAFALPTLEGRLRLLIRNEASLVEFGLAAASGVGAVGFTPEGKVWVLTGLASTVPWPVTYLLYEER